MTSIKENISTLLTTTKLYTYNNKPLEFWDLKKLDNFNQNFVEQICIILNKVLIPEICCIIAKELLNNSSITMKSIVIQLYNIFSEELIPIMSNPNMLWSSFESISKYRKINICLFETPSEPEYILPKHFKTNLIFNNNYKHSMVIFTSISGSLYSNDPYYHIKWLYKEDDSCISNISDPIPEFISKTHYFEHTLNLNFSYDLLIYSPRHINNPIINNGFPTYKEMLDIFMCYCDSYTYTPRHKNYVLRDFILDCIMICSSKAGFFIIIYKNKYYEISFLEGVDTIITYLNSNNGTFSLSNKSIKYIHEHYSKGSLLDLCYNTLEIF
jgi:hypothetical protein